MIIREFSVYDCPIVSKLFYDTVHSVNKSDYTEHQLTAWASSPEFLFGKCGDLEKQKTLIAENDGIIVGFGSIRGDGYLDYLFVHRDWQRQGVATIICEELERSFDVVRTHSSITAKKFFEKRGYKVVCEEEVERNGTKLKRYEMRVERG